jgi:hypothetical protein
MDCAWSGNLTDIQNKIIIDLSGGIDMSKSKDVKKDKKKAPQKTTKEKRKEKQEKKKNKE